MQNGAGLGPPMDPIIAKTIDTLRKARDALRSEMELWAEAAVLDEVRLGRLGEAARSFKEQAHSLLVMMLYENVPEALQQDIETLISDFSDIAVQIEVMLASSKRRT